MSDMSRWAAVASASVAANITSGLWYTLRRGARFAGGAYVWGQLFLSEIQRKSAHAASPSPQRLPDVRHEGQSGVEAGAEAHPPRRLDVINKAANPALLGGTQLLQGLR